jgi:hypothetical protein
MRQCECPPPALGSLSLFLHTTSLSLFLHAISRLSLAPPPDALHAIAPDNTGRWCDCDHDVILFDDVEAGSIPPFSQWKRLCDRYPFKVPVKGGFVDSSPGSQELSSSPAISYPTNGGPSSSKTPSPELRSIDVLRK